MSKEALREIKRLYGPLFREELTERCAPFWFSGYDREHGGIMNCLDNAGNVYATDKGVWMQGRTAWTYSELYRTVAQNEDYLRLADSCLTFEEKHCFDKDGRMLDTVTRAGEPVSKAEGSWFSETFYISGCAAYYRATGDDARLVSARRLYEKVIKMYTGEEKDPYPGSVGFTTSRPTKALCTPMILTNVTGIMRDADPENADFYNAVSDRLIKDIHAFYDEEHRVMRECVGLDGGFIDECSDGRVVNPGHDLECSWFLLEEALCRGDESGKLFAKTVYDTAMRCGWDTEYGGLMYYRDALGRPMELLDFDMRIWWAHCEGIIASLMMYKVFGEEKYAEDFRKITDYSFARFSDREHGEWYGMLHRDGTPTLPPFKGHTYKGAFHVMRMLMKVLAMTEG